MSNAKHTPGPWGAECRDLSDTHRKVGDDGVRYWDVGPGFSGSYRGEVCTVHSAVHIDGITIEQRDANARLIAAAPDLLEALQSAAHFVREHYAPSIDAEHDLMGKINAAIARATGAA